ncbi:hypothetical protein [Rhizobiales bacterium]|uniref:hypothetical protein n=1 Tax=Ensifer adhaerens TaxID=106592 RepID=UPI000DE453F3
MLALVFSDIDGGGGSLDGRCGRFRLERLFLAPRGFGDSVVSRTRHLSFNSGWPFVDAFIVYGLGALIAAAVFYFMKTREQRA